MTLRTQTLPFGFGMRQKLTGAEEEHIQNSKTPEVNTAASSTTATTLAASSLNSRPQGKANFHFAPESPGISPNLGTYAPNLDLLPPPPQSNNIAGNGEVFKDNKRKLVRHSNSADDVIRGKIKQVYPSAKTVFSRLDLEEPSFSIDLTFEDSDEELL